MPATLSKPVLPTPAHGPTCNRHGCTEDCHWNGSRWLRECTPHVADTNLYQRRARAKKKKNAKKNARKRTNAKAAKATKTSSAASTTTTSQETATRSTISASQTLRRGVEKSVSTQQGQTHKERTGTVIERKDPETGEPLREEEYKEITDMITTTVTTKLSETMETINEKKTAYEHITRNAISGDQLVSEGYRDQQHDIPCYQFLNVLDGDVHTRYTYDARWGPRLASRYGGGGVMELLAGHRKLSHAVNDLLEKMGFGVVPVVDLLTGLYLLDNNFADFQNHTTRRYIDGDKQWGLIEPPCHTGMPRKRDRLTRAALSDGIIREVLNNTGKWRARVLGTRDTVMPKPGVRIAGRPGRVPNFRPQANEQDAVVFTIVDAEMYVEEGWGYIGPLTSQRPRLVEMVAKAGGPKLTVDSTMDQYPPQEWREQNPDRATTIAKLKHMAKVALSTRFLEDNYGEHKDMIDLGDDLAFAVGCSAAPEQEWRRRRVREMRRNCAALLTTIKPLGSAKWKAVKNHLAILDIVLDGVKANVEWRDMKEVNQQYREIGYSLQTRPIAGMMMMDLWTPRLDRVVAMDPTAPIRVSFIIPKRKSRTFLRRLVATRGHVVMTRHVGYHGDDEIYHAQRHQGRKMLMAHLDADPDHFKRTQEYYENCYKARKMLIRMNQEGERHVVHDKKLGAVTKLDPVAQERITQALYEEARITKALYAIDKMIHTDVASCPDKGPARAWVDKHLAYIMME